MTPIQPLYSMLETLLDEVCAAVTAPVERVWGGSEGAMEQLCTRLSEIRRTCPNEVWDQEIVPRCFRHPLREVVHQDPYTHRAYVKPRGYAGDAIMIDYIYSRCAPTGTSLLGKKVFDYTTGCSNAESVRARRDRIAVRIDEVAQVRKKPRILSIACGHLREVEQSKAVCDGLIGEFVAVDQDVESINFVKREYGRLGVRCVCSPIRDLLKGNIEPLRFDLIYATGLYDYLPDLMAKRLTKQLFKLLAPGGNLLVANFLPDSMGRGYMETFMNWRLTYRTVRELESLGEQIQVEEVSRAQSSQDEWGNIGYLEIVRT